MTNALLPARCDGNPPPAVSAGEFDDATAPLFGLATTDVLDQLLEEHAAMRCKVEQVKALVDGGLADAFAHFIEGNAGDQTVQRAIYLDRLFRLDGALKALDAAFWKRTLRATDIWDFMPESHRADWRTRLTAWKKGEPAPADMLPPFSPEVVRPTIRSLLARRAQFLIERVDGVFRNLSRTHVTNMRDGFSRRMILSAVFDHYGSVCIHKTGYVHDLRAVVAKFMGNAEPSHNETDPLLRRARDQAGQWLTIDGGALRLRAFSSTVHLEVHPEIAWRLNALLAAANPCAIPERFRARPTKASAGFGALVRPLPFDVRHLLGSAGHGEGRDTLRLTAVHEKDKPALPPAARILETMGAFQCGDECFRFGYDPSAVLDEIWLSGCVPDALLREFAQTPPDLAADALALADVGDDDLCLEPSAGTGMLARLLPAERTTCVERNRAYCRVLRAHGLQVEEGDFVEWAAHRTQAFARIVMHPPSFPGIWQRHLEAASRLLADGGRLVAILPADASRTAAQQLLPGCRCNWSDVYPDSFPGSAMAVVLLCAECLDE